MGVAPSPLIEAISFRARLYRFYCVPAFSRALGLSELIAFIGRDRPERLPRIAHSGLVYLNALKMRSLEQLSEAPP